MARKKNIKSVVNAQCQCNFCRLNRYDDDTVMYAYLVGVANTAEQFIKLLEENGWKNYGLCDDKHKKNTGWFRCDLEQTQELIGDLVRNNKLRLILRDNLGNEIK